jgi:inhibitor of KinA sporulation pathway (predicted exonuclease)
VTTSRHRDKQRIAMRESSLILVVDLEATCANDRSLPPEAMEIIEIGAVWATGSGTIIDRFQAFVRPLERPVLTAFCTALTGIRQADVDAAPLFPVAASSLHEFANLHRGPDAAWASWGDYDRKQIERDCARHRMTDPLPLPHENAKRLFAEHQQIGKAIGMDKACSLVGIDLEGQLHRALDDAINTARLLPWVLGSRSLLTRPRS